MTSPTALRAPGSCICETSLPIKPIVAMTLSTEPVVGQAIPARLAVAPETLHKLLRAPKAVHLGLGPLFRETRCQTSQRNSTLFALLRSLFWSRRLFAAIIRRSGIVRRACIVSRTCFVEITAVIVRESVRRKTMLKNDIALQSHNNPR